MIELADAFFDKAQENLAAAASELAADYDTQDVDEVRARRAFRKAQTLVVAVSLERMSR